MKPYVHASINAKQYGGKPDDYLPIHDLMDSSKSAVADNRHRCVFHSAFGIYIVEKIFGTNITNSDGKLVSVRSIAEDHIIQDLGVIPTLQDYLEGMELKDWMQRATKESYPASAKDIMKNRKTYKIGKD